MSPRPRERILGNLEAIYREAYERAKAAGDQTRMADVDAAYQREQLLLEVLLDIRDALAVPPAGAGESLAVGESGAGARYVGSRTRVIRAGGGLVLPGFTDGHTHFIDGGFQLASVDLRDAATPQEFVRQIREYARSLKSGEWITG